MHTRMMLDNTAASTGRVSVHAFIPLVETLLGKTIDFSSRPAIFGLVETVRAFVHLGFVLWEL